jgi:hypothetical protein
MKNDMNISKQIIKELKSVGFHNPISDPKSMLFVTKISHRSASVIKANSKEVFISRMALKHIIDSRGDKAERVIEVMPIILGKPDKIADNSLKTENSFLFAGKLDRHYGVVLEITKTTGLSNQVVSAFIINDKTYEKIHDISGGTAPPR